MCYYTVGQQMVSEANASYSVLAVLLSLFPNCKKLFFVRCEPSVKDHATFTDFLIKPTVEEECIIVEVKFWGDILLVQSSSTPKS